VPIAHANDGLGSVRIPAACCGLVGLKPGRGVVPSGLGANDWFGLTEHGILATTVADATVGFSVLAGRTPGPLQRVTELRVGISLRSPVAGVTPDTDARRAAIDTGRRLVGAGHNAVQADPAYPTQLGVRGMATWFASAFLDAQQAGLDVRSLQPRTRRHIELGKSAMRRGLVREADRVAWRERCLNWFHDRRIDILITPALAGPPPRAANWAAGSWAANMVANVRFAPYSAPWNIAGFPAVVVPAGVRADGLPNAVQLVGRPGSELSLLAVAGELEQLAPWRRHAPGWPRTGTRRVRTW
jgi:amidase